MNKGALGIPRRNQVRGRTWEVFDEIRIPNGSTTGPHVDFKGLPQDRTHIQIVGQMRSMIAGTNASVSMRFNGDASAIYDCQYHQANDATPASGTSAAQVAMHPLLIAAGNTAGANKFAPFRIDIPNYCGSSVTHRSATAQSVMYEAAVLTLIRVAGGVYRSTAPITRVQLGDFVGGTLTFAPGSVFTLLVL